MFELARRNLTIFFRDKTAVLLSFLAEFIIVGLYILFIRDNLIASFSGLENADLLMDVWMIAGLLGVTSVTTTMGIFGILIEDRVKKIQLDFFTSPISKGSLLGGYLLSAVSVGLLMSFVLLLFSEGYIYFQYGIKLASGTIIYIYSELLLTTVANSSLVLLLVSFLNSSNALAACCTVIGALMGFLTGIYLPLGSLPEKVGVLVKCFPVSHSVALFRQTLMDPLIAENFGSSDTAPALEFAKYMGVRYTWSGEFFSAQGSTYILLATALLCLLAAVFSLSKRNKN